MSRNIFLCILFNSQSCSLNLAYISLAFIVIVPTLKIQKLSEISLLKQYWNQIVRSIIWELSRKRNGYADVRSKGRWRILHQASVVCSQHSAVMMQNVSSVVIKSTANIADVIEHSKESLLEPVQMTSVERESRTCLRIKFM